MHGFRITTVLLSVIHTQGHLKKRKMAAAIGQNPFNLTAAGELGAHRETMLNNELLLRVSVDFLFFIIPIVKLTNFKSQNETIFFTTFFPVYLLCAFIALCFLVVA